MVSTGQQGERSRSSRTSSLRLSLSTFSEELASPGIAAKEETCPTLAQGAGAFWREKNYCIRGKSAPVTILVKIVPRPSTAPGYHLRDY